RRTPRPTPSPTATPTPAPIRTPTPTALPYFPTRRSSDLYTGWTTTGNQNIYSSAFAPTTEGVQGVQFNGGQATPNGTLSQTFATVRGATDNIRFTIGVYT